MNRFKGLDLIDSLKNYGQRFITLYSRQWSKPSKRKRNARRQSGCLRRLYKCWGKKRSERYGRKGKICPTECRVPEKSKKRKKTFFNEQCQEIEENRTGETRDLFKKTGGIKGIFHEKMNTIKDKNSMNLTEAEDIKKRWHEWRTV